MSSPLVKLVPWIDIHNVGLRMKDLWVEDRWCNDPPCCYNIITLKCEILILSESSINLILITMVNVL